MKYLTAAIAGGLMVFGHMAIAQDFSAELKARQGQFRIMALNLGELGAMAKGEKPFEQAAADRAAASLVGISQVDQSLLWKDGSDNMAIDNTRALPSIWDKNDDFLAKWGDFGEAAAALQKAVATGPEALGPAMGQIGGTCKACHEAHRAPAN